MRCVIRQLLDSRLTSKPHTWLKRQELNREYELLRRLPGPTSKHK